MEITFKFIIDGVHPKKNFTLPVRLRLYQGRNYKEFSLGFSVLKQQWNNQLQQVLASNPDHLTYNTRISSIRSKIQKFLLLNEDRDSLITPKELIDHLCRKESRSQIIKPDIFLYGKQHIAKLQATGNTGNAIAYSCAINKLKEFAKTESLHFEVITYKYLESFNGSMLAEGIKINSISLYLRTIRALFNKAIKDGTLDAKFYPFSSFKIKSEKTISRALTKPEMAKIASLKLTPHTSIWHQRNLFLLSFCFIGINLADLLTLTKESLVDGRIVFRRKKTHKVYSIRVHGIAKEIFNHYFTLLPESTREFLLPFVKQKNSPITLKKDIQQAIKNCNDYLGKLAEQCKIEKSVTTYYARYSWANIAKGLGFSKDLIAEALGHEYGNKVTGIYLDNYDNATIDSMNEKVIKAVFRKF